MHPQNRPTHTFGPYWRLHSGSCTFPLAGRAHLVSRGPSAGRRQQQQKEKGEKRDRWPQRPGARPGPRRAPAAASVDPRRPRVSAHGSNAAAAATAATAATSSASASRGFPGLAGAG